MPRRGLTPSRNGIVAAGVALALLAFVGTFSAAHGDGAKAPAPKGPQLAPLASTAVVSVRSSVGALPAQKVTPKPVRPKRRAAPARARVRVRRPAVARRSSGGTRAGSAAPAAATPQVRSTPAPRPAAPAPRPAAPAPRPVAPAPRPQPRPAPQPQPKPAPAQSPGSFDDSG